MGDNNGLRDTFNSNKDAWDAVNAPSSLVFKDNIEHLLFLDYIPY